MASSIVISIGTRTFLTVIFETYKMYLTVTNWQGLCLNYAYKHQNNFQRLVEKYYNV